MIAEPDLGTIQDDRLRRLFRYWHQIRGDRLMPRRQDLDPSEIRSVLPIIWLFDFLPDVGRFRCRLAGDQINEIFGFSLIGRFLDEVLPEKALTVAHRRYLKVVEEHLIAHCSGFVYLRLDRTATGERMVFPLSDDGITGTGVVGATAYRWEKGAGPYARERLLSERFVRITPPGAEPIDRWPELL